MMTETAYEKVYICVDDTDDLTKTTSTGSIADEIARRIGERFNAALNMGITRHQLLLDERVPYTSHNSSMCFDIVLPEGCAAEADEIGWEVIHGMRADSSNPGLCIFPIPLQEQVPGNSFLMETAPYQRIIEFGTRAKTELIYIEEARETARMFPEMILKSEGVSGQGMIGALAGVGLRMTGNDGRFRGKYDLSFSSDDGSCTVQRFIESFQERYGVTPALIDQDGDPLEMQAQINPVREAKAVLKAGHMTFFCGRDDHGIWRPYSKDEFNKKRKKREACESFVLDPDQEERFHEKKRGSCGSCLYRRLTADGYICMVGNERFEG